MESLSQWKHTLGFVIVIKVKLTSYTELVLAFVIIIEVKLTPWLHPYQQLKSCRLVVGVGEHILRDTHWEDLVEISSLFLVTVWCPLSPRVSQLVGTPVSHSIIYCERALCSHWLLDLVS